MAAQRLSKLQKIILTVLSVKDQADWEGFYSKHQPQNKSPYWYKVRREYYDPDGSGYKSHYENGIKGIVEEVYLKQKGFNSFAETTGKTNYFNTPENKQILSRFGKPYDYGASPFTVSFSRAIKTLWLKDLIEVKFWKKQIKEIKLNVNNKASKS